MQMKPGAVYLIRNTTNDKVYVGRTVGPVDLRWKQHVCDAVTRRRCHILSRAIRKYGVEAFEVALLAADIPETELDNLERIWIILLDSTDSRNGYNSTKGGLGGVPVGEAREKLRYPRTAATRKKMSMIAKRRGTAHMNTPEARAKKSAKLKGRIFSPQHCLAISRRKKGQTLTAEHIAKIRLWRPSFWRGKPVISGDTISAMKEFRAQGHSLSQTGKAFGVSLSHTHRLMNREVTDGKICR